MCLLLLVLSQQMGGNLHPDQIAHQRTVSRAAGLSAAFRIILFRVVLRKILVYKC